jgi:hypothetical protein
MEKRKKIYSHKITQKKPYFVLFFRISINQKCHQVLLSAFRAKTKLSIFSITENSLYLYFQKHDNGKLKNYLIKSKNHQEKNNKKG